MQPSLAEQLQAWQKATPEWKPANRHERRKQAALARIAAETEAAKRREVKR